MGKLFGTDGLRGVANADLTCELSYKTGRAAAEVLTKALSHRPTILIGRDTRISGDMLEAALVAGFCSVGADVKLLGILPTPAVAYLVRKYKADAGVVISASHNPFEYNGIKIFNAEGFKLSDALENEIEDILLGVSPEPDLKTGSDVGTVRTVDDAIDDYVEFLKNCADEDLTGLHILVDCANGASYKTARKLFKALGADVKTINDIPNGVNINKDCGSTHIEQLGKMVRESGNFDVGIAFDGDADRCLLVDENGDLIDGDKILAVCGKYLSLTGKLRGNTVVATVMSNMGFFEFAKGNGIDVTTTKVGDRYVLEEMLKQGYVLGGEQSGHVIFLDHNTTGDGELTALKFLEIMKKSGKTASNLAEVMDVFPQKLINIKVENSKKDGFEQDEKIKSAIKSAESELGSLGRVLVRASGTEALIRVMVEGKQRDLVEKTADFVARVIEEQLS